jgi:hypothetical protein
MNRDSTNAIQLYGIIVQLERSGQIDTSPYQTKDMYEKIVQLSVHAIPETINMIVTNCHVLKSHKSDSIAGNARKELEQKSGRSVISRGNYLGAEQTSRKKLKDKWDE